MAENQWLADSKVQGLSTDETVCSKVNSLRILQVRWAADHSAASTSLADVYLIRQARLRLETRRACGIFSGRSGW